MKDIYCPLCDKIVETNNKDYNLYIQLIHDCILGQTVFYAASRSKIGTNHYILSAKNYRIQFYENGINIAIIPYSGNKQILNLDAKKFLKNCKNKNVDDLANKLLLFG